MTKRYRVLPTFYQPNVSNEVLTHGSFHCVQVFTPDDVFLLVWGITMILVIFYQVFTVPYFLAFDVNDSDATLVLDFISAMVYFGDILVTFNTGFYKKGLLIINRKAICKRYLKTWLCLDVASSFPYNWLFQSPFEKMRIGNYQTPALLKTIKISRLLRTFRLIRIMKIHKYLGILEQKVNNKLSILFTAFSLILVMTSIAHWAACGFYYISQLQESFQSWIFLYQIEDSSYADKYMTALYWAITTLTTTGYGDIVPVNPTERIYVIIFMILSAGMFSFLIGKIAMAVSLMERDSNEHKELLLDVTRYLKAAKVSKDVSNRALRYLDYVWETRNRRKVVDKRLLSQVSEPLKNEITEHIFGKVLARVKMLEMFEPEFVNQLARSVEPEIYAQDDIIFETNQASTEVYFLEKGNIEIFHMASTHTFAILKVSRIQPGQHFGEIAFFSGAPRTASARCLQFAELLSMKRDALLSLVRLSPNAMYTLQSICQKIEVSEFSELGISCYICKDFTHLASQCEIAKVQVDREDFKTKWMKLRETPGILFKPKEKKSPNFIRKDRKVKLGKGYKTINVKSERGWEHIKKRRDLFAEDNVDVVSSRSKGKFRVPEFPEGMKRYMYAVQDLDADSTPVNPYRRYSMLGGVKTYPLSEELQRCATSLVAKKPRTFCIDTSVSPSEAEHEADT